MERRMEVVLEVGGYNREREKEIMTACMVEWNFRDDDFSRSRGAFGQRKLLRAAALGTLLDGEDRDDIVKRIENAVWRANNNPCHVAVGTRAVGWTPLDCDTPEDEEYERQIA